MIKHLGIPAEVDKAKLFGAVVATVIFFLCDLFMFK